MIYMEYVVAITRPIEIPIDSTWQCLKLPSKINSSPIKFPVPGIPKLASKKNKKLPDSHFLQQSDIFIFLSYKC